MTKRRTIGPTQTKAQIRDEIERQMDQFLSAGGQVEYIPNGVSGNEKNANLFSHSTNFEPRKERTPVNDVVRELEARKRTKGLVVKKTAGPRKRLLTDDFGEPLRWVWEDK